MTTTHDSTGILVDNDLDLETALKLSLPDTLTNLYRGDALSLVGLMLEIGDSLYVPVGIDAWPGMTIKMRALRVDGGCVQALVFLSMAERARIVGRAKITLTRF